MNILITVDSQNVIFGNFPRDKEKIRDQWTISIHLEVAVQYTWIFPRIITDRYYMALERNNGVRCPYDIFYQGHSISNMYLLLLI